MSQDKAIIWGWAQGGCWLCIPNLRGIFLSSLFFSSLCIAFLGFPNSPVVNSLPLKPHWLYLVRLVMISQFSIERKGSSKDKRHWKELPLPSNPAPCLLHVPRPQEHHFFPSLCCLPFLLCALPADLGCSFLPCRVPGCPSSD